MHRTTGPLTGLRVVEFTGIGPGPHCVMLLADLGAEVLRIDRSGGNGWPNPIVDRGRHTIEVDIRSSEGRERALQATDHADVLVEGFRPGVMERLGLGPDVVHARNPRLIYGRMTGWGQSGALSQSAGHDINYIALSGALDAMGLAGQPATPPLNLVGDFGGGSMLLAFGIMAALWEREKSGEGQVVDAAIVDGVSSLISFFAGFAGNEALSLDRGKNMLGGAAPFYRCYICADGKEIAIGPIERQFYRELLERIDAPMTLLDEQHDQKKWPEHAAILSGIFATRSRDEWSALLLGTDACAAPVLSLAESMQAQHLRDRASYVVAEGINQAAPVPRFSRTPGNIPGNGDGAALLDAWAAAPKR